MGTQQAAISHARLTLSSQSCLCTALCRFRGSRAVVDVVVASSVELSESPAQPVRCRLSGMSALPDGRGKVYEREVKVNTKDHGKD